MHINALSLPLALCTIVAATINHGQLQARQVSNSSTQTLVENPQTTFGAAAAAIQSAIAVGQALRSSSPVDETIPASETSTVSQTLFSTSTTIVASIATIVTTDIPEPQATNVQAVKSVIVRPGFSLPAVLPIPVPTTAPTTASTTTTAITTESRTSAVRASIGNQGTVTTDDALYTTVVVASYVTVAAQATTFYENGIAYVASYAGQTLTVTDCPCTRSARIVVMTTTLCNTCSNGVATSAALPEQSVMSANNPIYTGSAGRKHDGPFMKIFAVAAVLFMTSILM